VAALARPAYEYDRDRDGVADPEETIVERPAARPVAAAPVTTRTVAPEVSPAGLAARILLTLLGAAGMIVSAFLVWNDGVQGSDLGLRSLIETAADTAPQFVASVGFVMIVLGLLAIVGLAPRTGWLTCLAGALGVVTVVLYGIEVMRADGTDGLSALDLGVWVALAGSLVALVGGFFGARRSVVVVDETVA
jgi:hypothetical protein